MGAIVLPFYIPSCKNPPSLESKNIVESRLWWMGMGKFQRGM